MGVPADLFNEREMLEGIARWVEIDSPTHDRDSVNRMMDAAAATMYGLGATITRHPGRDGLGDAVWRGSAPTSRGSSCSRTWTRSTRWGQPPSGSATTATGSSVPAPMT